MKEITLKSKSGTSIVFKGRLVGASCYPTVWNWITYYTTGNNRGFTNIYLYRLEDGTHIKYKFYGADTYGKWKIVK